MISNPNKFRHFILSSGVDIFLGRDAENNELLVSQAQPTEILLHTAMPGSPFCNIKVGASKDDIKEAAIYTAKFSQDWRDRKSDVIIHVFRGCDTYKDKKMKAGTFGVKNIREMRVKKGDILRLEENLKIQHE